MRCGHICKLPGRVLGVRAARLSLAAVLTLLLVAGALTTFLPSNKDDKVLQLRREVKAQGRHDRDAFTLVMQTYNRTDLLLRLLNHYQALPRLHRVIVVWNNVGEKAPEDLWNSLGPHPVPVVFKPQTTNRMRNRLQAFPELETEAVLMVDDDMLISAQDLAFAFSVWQMQEQMRDLRHRGRILWGVCPRELLRCPRRPQCWFGPWSRPAARSLQASVP